MNELQLINDICDCLMSNTEYCTQEQFTSKYEDFFIEVDDNEKCIRIMDDHNEWRLMLQKVWNDGHGE